MMQLRKKFVATARNSLEQNSAVMLTRVFSIIVPVIMLMGIINVRRSDVPAIDNLSIIESSLMGEDPYAETRRMCDKNGKCGEVPDVPSPRTVYSARSIEQYNRWVEAHASLKRTAAVYAARRRHRSKKGRALILLGDSITESWIGTAMGKDVARADGVPDVLKNMATDNKLDPLVLGIGGDQTQHLIYRLQNGELLPAFADEDNAVFVILIGTNNLGSGMLPDPTAKGVRAVAEYILDHTKGHLAVMDLLPRGDGKVKLPRLCPPRCRPDGDPFKSFIPAITKVNSRIDHMVPELQKEYGRRIGHFDCGGKFLAADDRNEVDINLMPDLIHPNKDGHKLLAQCMMQYINGIAT